MRKAVLFLLIFVCTRAQSQRVIDRQIDSLYALGQRYSAGSEKDEARAFGYYKQCAELGHAKSMSTMGFMFKRGRGVPANGNSAAYWFQRAGEEGYPKGWYYLGLHHKGMQPPAQDFQKAYECFSRGAVEGDNLSEFMKGYMHYKGLGCNQDYEKAAMSFRKAAALGVSNSMYFLGLCFRNGYGVEMNGDSATYWLNMAVKKQNHQAVMELNSEEAENGNTLAKGAALKITNAAFPEPSTPVNRYVRMEEGISSGIIAGTYTGHLIKYDWSGKHVIEVTPLVLEINGKDGVAYGTWIENDTIRVPLAARVAPNNIGFLNTSYNRKDHYSPNRPLNYRFESANLRWVVKGDTVFLAGNVHLFSPSRNEPHKPMSVALTKTSKHGNGELIKFSADDSPKKTDELIVYPNPFKTELTVNFYLKEKCEVTTELVSMDGRVVYSNRAGVLDAGFYTLPLLPKQILSGIYILTLKYGSKTKTSKVIRD